MADTTYSGLPRPYDDTLQRKDDLSYVLGDAIIPGSEGGSVEEVSVKTGGSLADLWITKKISSVNWKPKKVGFMLDGQTGRAEFTDVYISGAITAISGTIGGWSIGTNAIFYDGATATLSAGMAPGDYPFYAGQTFSNRASAPFRVTVAGVVYATGAVIDGTSTIGGRTASILSGAINASGNFVDAQLDTSAKKILKDFTFGSTDYSGAVKAGTITWNASTGAITGGSGGVFHKGGIVFANAGVATITLDASTGNATFAGTLSGASGTFGTITSGNITGVTITGGTIQTDSFGLRVALLPGGDGTYNNDMIGFLSGSTAYGRIYPTTYTGGSGIAIETIGAVTDITLNEGTFSGLNLYSSLVGININGYNSTIEINGATTVNSTFNSTNHLSITGDAFLRLRSMTGATASGLSGIQNGCIYYRSDVGDIRAYINGAWRTLSNTA